MTAIPAIERRLLVVAGDVLPRPHANCYWLIAGQILAGEYPAVMPGAAARARLDALLDAGVRRFVDLTGAGEGAGAYAPALAERAAARGLRVAHHGFAIPDFGVPSTALMRAALDAIYAALDAGEPAYVHCVGGVGRTGTLVGCLLREQGFTAAEALAVIGDKWRVMAKRSRYPHSPETIGQVAFIERWRGE